jgi:hypothetical protein
LLGLGERFLSFYLRPQRAYSRLIHRMEPWIRPNPVEGVNTKESRTIHEIKRALYTAACNHRFTRYENGKVNYLLPELSALADELDRTQGADMKSAAGAWRVVDRLEAIAPTLKEYSWMVMLRELAEEGRILPQPPRGGTQTKGQSP